MQYYLYFAFNACYLFYMVQEQTFQQNVELQMLIIYYMY